MKKYLHHMRTERTPHERRQAAVQIAGVLTALLFVGWIATLGIRFSAAPSVAQDEDAVQLTASVQSGIEAVQTGINSIYYQPTPNSTNF